MNIIQIKDSSEKQNLELFLEVARNVYKNDKIWSPSSDQVFLQRYKSYEQKKDVSVTPIILLEDNIPCARAVAISKNNLTSSKGKKQGWISYFDISKEYQSYANSFLDHAENILKEREIESILVPRFDNSIAGLQISKFELPHTFLSTYNLPFYYDIFLNRGYKTIKKFLTFYYTRENIPKIRFRFPSIRTRTFDSSNFESELESFHEISLKSFEQTFGYIPRTFDEDYEMVKSMLPFLDNELVIIAENKQEEVIGFLTCVPDVYQQMQGKNVTNVRLMTIAVLPEYRKRGTAIAMCLHLMRNLIKKVEYQYLEISSIREDNIPSLKLITRFGAQKGKEYVILEKEL